MLQHKREPSEVMFVATDGSFFIARRFESCPPVWGFAEKMPISARITSYRTR